MPPSSAKRKRGNENSSDDEDTSFGKQILPVANLPVNFDGEPMDGLQYLFTVRRDARRLPDVTRVQNPYAPPPRAIPPSTHSSLTSHPSIPSRVWCTLLETRFRNLRGNLDQQTGSVGSNCEPRGPHMPEKKERDLWWAFLEGKPEREWNVSPRESKKKTQGKRPAHGLRAWADETQQESPIGVVIHESSLLIDEGEVEEALKPDPAELLPTPSGTPAPQCIDTQVEDEAPIRPREPSTRLLKLINEPTALHLLMYFTHWINKQVQKVDQNVFPLRNAHARWIFALLSRIDDHVSADDMNLLRNLVRACLSLLKQLIERELAPSTTKAAILPDAMSKQSCWIIISIVVHVWKQRDLWVDAEGVLARFPATAI